MSAEQIVEWLYVTYSERFYAFASGQPLWCPKKFSFWKVQLSLTEKFSSWEVITPHKFQPIW